MRALTHPLRLDSSGAMSTVDESSDRFAGQLAGVVLATGAGERPLAPEYGLADPTATVISLSVIAATVSRCEPDLTVRDITSTTTDDQAVVALSVTWAD
jgi:hypothetical protein